MASSIDSGDSSLSPLAVKATFAPLMSEKTGHGFSIGDICDLDREEVKGTDLRVHSRPRAKLLVFVEADV